LQSFAIEDRGNTLSPARPGVEVADALLAAQVQLRRFVSKVPVLGPLITRLGSYFPHLTSLKAAMHSVPERLFADLPRGLKILNLYKRNLHLEKKDIPIVDLPPSLTYLKIKGFGTLSRGAMVSLPSTLLHLKFGSFDAEDGEPLTLLPPTLQSLWFSLSLAMEPGAFYAALPASITKLKHIGGNSLPDIWYNGAHWPPRLVSLRSRSILVSGALIPEGAQILDYAPYAEPGRSTIRIVEAIDETEELTSAEWDLAHLPASLTAIRASNMSRLPKKAIRRQILSLNLCQLLPKGTFSDFPNLTTLILEFRYGSVSWRLMKLPKTLTHLEVQAQESAPPDFELPEAIEVLHSPCFNPQLFSGLSRLKEWRTNMYSHSVKWACNSSHWSLPPSLTIVSFSPSVLGNLLDVMKCVPNAVEVHCFTGSIADLEQYATPTWGLRSLRLDRLLIPDMEALVTHEVSFYEPTSEGCWDFNKALLRELQNRYPCLSQAPEDVLEVAEGPRNSILKAFELIPPTVSSVNLASLKHLPTIFGRHLLGPLTSLDIRSVTTLNHATAKTLPRTLTRLLMSGHGFNEQAYADLPRGLLRLELLGLTKLWPAHCSQLPPNLTSLTIEVAKIKANTSNALPTSIQHLSINSFAGSPIQLSMLRSLPPKLLSFSTNFTMPPLGWLINVLPPTITRLDMKNRPDHEEITLFLIHQLELNQALRESVKDDGVHEQSSSV
jgi:hypothetical protein